MMHCFCECVSFPLFPPTWQHHLPVSSWRRHFIIEIIKSVYNHCFGDGGVRGAAQIWITITQQCECYASVSCTNNRHWSFGWAAIASSYPAKPTSLSLVFPFRFEIHPRKRSNGRVGNGSISVAAASHNLELVIVIVIIIIMINIGKKKETRQNTELCTYFVALFVMAAVVVE